MFVSLVLAALAHAANVPPIVVFLEFESLPSQTSLRQMEQEATEILRPSGLQLDWRMLDQYKSGESFQDLVVVRFRGSCQMRNPALDSELGPGIGSGVLASTHVSDGHILPFSEVECDRVRRYIAPDVNSHDQEKRDEIYGRALGRVVAHEFYHIFAGTQHHGNEGVARSFHTRRDLTAKEFRFSGSASNALHELKWRALMASEGERPEIAAPVSGGSPSDRQSRAPDSGGPSRW